LFSGRIAFMGMMANAFEKLPTWAKGILVVLAILGGIYCVARYGFWPTLLRAIFSPEI
jgi:hypothetical protein